MEQIEMIREFEEYYRKSLPSLIRYEKRKNK